MQESIKNNTDVFCSREIQSGFGASLRSEGELALCLLS